MVGKARAPVSAFVQAVCLNHRSHPAVEKEDSLAEEFAELGSWLHKKIPAAKERAQGRGFLAVCFTWPQYAANHHVSIVPTI
jgi:hypothetical protein